MARATQSHTLWLLFANEESLRYMPAHPIMVRLCDAFQWLILHVISSCGTVSSSNSMRKKTNLAIWRQIRHITPLLCKVYLPITEGFAELEYYVSCTKLPIGRLDKHSSTFSHVNEAKKHLFVSAIDRYVTFHYRSSLIPSCKVCSKSSWSCTHGSIMLTTALRRGWRV